MTSAEFETAVRRPARSLGAILLASVLASVGALSIVMALNYLAFRSGPAQLVAEIRRAFDAGLLPAEHTITPDRSIGAFTYNDCTILAMAVEHRPPLRERIVSPARLKPVDAGTRPDDACAILRDAIALGHLEDYQPAPYHRYVAAAVAPAAVLVPILGLETYRKILKDANYLLLGGAFAFALVMSMRARSLTLVAARKACAGVVVFGILTVFSGAEFFAQNLSMGLADLVVWLFFALLLFASPLQWTPGRLVGTTAAAFAAIAALEQWTGQIPLALAGGVGLLALDVRTAAARSIAWRRAAQLFLTSAMTVILTFGIKLLVAAWVFEDEVIAGFVRQLLVRVGGADYGIGDLVLHLGARLAYIGQGSLLVGLLHMAGAAIAGSVGLRLLLRASPPGGVHRSIAYLLIASVGIVVGWHLLFRNQSTVHAFFMVRTLAWPAIVGWLLLLLAYESRRSVAGSLPPGRAGVRASAVCNVGTENMRILGIVQGAPQLPINPDSAAPASA